MQRHPRHRTDALGRSRFVGIAAPRGIPFPREPCSVAQGNLPRTGMVIGVSADLEDYESCKLERLADIHSNATCAANKVVSPAKAHRLGMVDP